MRRLNMSAHITIHIFEDRISYSPDLIEFIIHEIKSIFKRLQDASDWVNSTESAMEQVRLGPVSELGSTPIVVSDSPFFFLRPNASNHQPTSTLACPRSGTIHIFARWGWCSPIT